MELTVVYTAGSFDGFQTTFLNSTFQTNSEMRNFQITEDLKRKEIVHLTAVYTATNFDSLQTNSEMWNIETFKALQRKENMELTVVILQADFIASKQLFSIPHFRQNLKCGISRLLRLYKEMKVWT